MINLYCKRITRLGGFIIALTLLSACKPGARWYPDDLVAKLPYKVADTKDAKRMALQKRLNKQGLEIITAGQDYMIVIPANILFANESPRLTWGSYGVLNEVVCYLKEFRKVAIHINAYVNPCVSQWRDKALTNARARAVGNYLWSQGVRSRFIFTQGLGSDKPIVSRVSKGDAYPNSRIEITFRDAVI